MDYPINETTVPPAVKTGALAAALAKAQAEMKNPPKTKTAQVRMKTGGTYSYSYADLADVIECARLPLSKHGLAFVQLVETTDKTSILRTTLMHESGECVSSTYPLPYGCAAQEMGSAITYARRYSLSAILGLAAETDDDAQQAQSIPKGDGLRDELIERMGSAGLGNGAIMAAAVALGLGEGRTIEDLTGPAIAELFNKWPEVLAHAQESSKQATAGLRKADAPKAAEPTAEAAPEPEAATPAAEPSGAGIAPALVAVMKKSGVNPAMLKAYYVSKGHFPATVEPKDLPEIYVKKIIAAWSQALPSIKKGQ